MTGMYDVKESLGTLLDDEPPFELTGTRLIVASRGRRLARVGASLLVAASVAAAVGVGVTLTRNPSHQVAGPGGSATASPGPRDASAVKAEIFDAMKSRLRGIAQAYATTYGLTVNSVDGTCCGDPASPRGQYTFSLSLQKGDVPSVLNVTADYKPNEPLVVGCPTSARIGCGAMSQGPDPVAYIYGGRGPTSEAGRVLRLVRDDGTIVMVTADDPGDPQSSELDLFMYSIATDQNFDLGAAAAFAPARVVTESPTALAPTAVQSPTEVLTPMKVSGLVGIWAVDAPGETAATRLRVEVDRVQVWRACGTLEGTWKATRNGAFLSFFSGGSGACFDSPKTDLSTIGWVSGARGLRATANGWELLGPDGGVLARLTPGSKPKVPSTIAESGAELPTVTAKQAKALDAPAADLPAGRQPVTQQLLVGTWVPKDGSRGYVTLTANGRYVGDDGCNGASGAWAVDDTGRLLLATQGYTTSMFCNGRSVDRELSDASLVGLDGGTLVIYGPDGQVVDQLVYGTPPPRPTG